MTGAAIRRRVRPARAAMPALLGLALGACAAAGLSPQASVERAVCHTDAAAIYADFAGARVGDCIVRDAHRLSLMIHPERPAPINLSPWYAFRYDLAAGGPVTVELRYSLGEHRYRPKVWRAGRWEALDEAHLATGVDELGAYTAFQLPSNGRFIAAQEVIDAADTQDWATALARRGGGRIERIGRSREGRAIDAVSFGRDDARHVVLILGRQHPPEISGALALQAFAERLLDDSPEMRRFRSDVRIVLVPLVNPDGVEHGHWRTNRSGVDLNRDWRTQSQPETRAVAEYVGRLHRPGRSSLALVLDFHSTNRNLFYIQGAEERTSPAGFTTHWLTRARERLSGYEFAIEPRTAEPGSGTAKNYFYQNFGIPSITYEVGDDTGRADIAAAARVFASTLAETWRGAHL